MNSFICETVDILSKNTVSRLILLRRLLAESLKRDEKFVFSHQLARKLHATPASIRRDLMSIGFSGNPRKGYDVEELHTKIVNVLETSQGQRVALFGVGNLGRALLAFLPGRLPRISIVAAFDSNEEKTSRILYGCHTYPMSEVARIVPELEIRLAIIAVPAQSAQEVAERAVQAGVRGVLNFARTTLRLPAHVYVEYLDLTMSLETVAYYSSHQKRSKR